MAIKSQQTKFKVSTAASSAKTISGLTLAAPGVVTATAHALAAGTVGVVAAVGGTIEVNERAFVVKTPLTNTFELSSQDTTSYTAYTTGGTFTPQTMTEVGSVRSVQGFNGQASEIDVTVLRSTAKEFLIGLQDFGTVELGLFIVSDAGQAKLRSLKASGAIGTFSIELSDGTISAFRGYVQSFSFDSVTPDGAVSSSVTIRVTGEPAWFA